MSLILGVLNMGRVQAEARMTETAHVYEVTGTTNDPVTFADTPIEVVKYDAIVCQVKYPTAIVREHVQGTQTVAYQEPTIKFPSGTVIGKDWFIRIDDSTADTGLIGRVYRARGYGEAGQTTALRVPVGEVS